MAYTLKIGTHSLPVGQAGCRPSIRSKRDAQGRPYVRILSLEVEGMLFGDDSQAIKAEAALLKAALENGRADIILYDGSMRRTGVALTAADAVGGFIFNEDIRYTEVNGSQWETLLSFTFTSTAEYTLDGVTGGTLIAFNERISRLGNGGPRETQQEVLQGETVRVRLVEKTRCLTVQQGFAVGFGGWPNFPNPKWRQYLTNPEVAVTHTGGIGYANKEYRIDWEYKFESPRPLAGEPSLWR